MPVQFTDQDTRYSVASLVNSAQTAFTVNRDEDGKRTDGFMKDGFKVVTRVPVNLTLAALATLETVVRAILTAVTSILYPVTDKPVSYFAASTKLAGRAVVESLKGTLGYASVQEKKDAPAPTPTPVVPTPTRAQRAWTATKAAANYVWTSKGPAAKFAYNHKFKIGLGLALGYFVGIPAAKALWEGSKAGASTFGADIANKTVDAYERASTATSATVTGVKDAGVYVGSGIANVTAAAWNMVPNVRFANSTNSTNSSVVEPVVNATNSSVVQEVVRALNGTNTTANVTA